MPRLPASVSLRRVSPRVPLSSLIYPTVRQSSSITTPVAVAPVRKTPLFQLQSTTPRTYSTMSDHGNVITINSDAEYQEKVVQSQDPIVIDCYATWCGPCKAIAPKVAELSLKYPQAKFYQIDVDKLTETAADVGIRAMPTFLLYKGGEKQGDIVGANPPALEAGIKQLIQ